MNHQINDIVRFLNGTTLREGLPLSNAKLGPIGNVMLLYRLNSLGYNIDEFRDFTRSEAPIEHLLKPQ